MDRNQAKEFYPILQAFAEGRVIECRTKPSAVEGTDIPNDWTEMKDIEFWNHTEYRIKPEPKFRPFKDAEECWAEMHKHHPFGWVIKKGEKKILITEVLTFGVNLHRQEACYGFYQASKILTFADGLPFGVKE